MKIVATIEARMGSSRLPGKVLKFTCGKPMLLHQVERTRRARSLTDVVVCTTVDPSDDVIENLCREFGISYFRGSVHDITDRLVSASVAHAIDLIVQTTGDCPLHDPDVIDAGVETYLSTNVEYVSNRLERSWPTGLDTQVYKPEVLRKVLQKTSDPVDREHGSYYIYTHPREFTMKNFASRDIHCPEKRWCLDYPEDFQFIDAVYRSLYPSLPGFNTYDVLDLLKRNPQLEMINQKHPVDIKPYEWFETISH